MQNIRAANNQALTSVKRIIDNAGIPSRHKWFVREIIGQIGPNNNLYNLQALQYGPVVEVVTTVTSKSPNYTLTVMLDVDIPGPESKSKQEPHVGCEVELNSGRVGNDHIELAADVLNIGRPQLGQDLEVYGWNVDDDLLKRCQAPDGVEVDVKFRRYKF